ncbi:Structural maintenance of chromosomes protein 1 [Knufia obscura]|uniref:Structural maintenance of chromosomes protein n=2 Tax=Knufia TaxID=430999 RepID=A0AAN8I6L7_9EURO|nr:Structural maintenance of chromosomes protein 1 [Knufia obscura]KAK5954739.1 Structural maintenance of chromosomes protein 1 [Knufia fluminis]
MGKLMRLELFNFKSYKGHHTLLFGDAYFTSIIGPNGSGKSNSMDAISFVLGIKSSHLRSAHLRELIYRGRVIRKSIATGDAQARGNDEEESTQTSTQGNDPKSAWVMAVFEDDAGETQKWKRTITTTGVSEYRINDKVVTSQQYNEALETENILIKARNFLVFQGDVEAIAIQKPQDLTRLIEQVSGSLEYKADYDRLKAEQDEANDQQSLQVNRRRGINAEIRQYKEQKDEADKFMKKTEERDNAIATHILWKLYHLQQDIERSQSEIQKHQNEVLEFQRGMEKFNKALEAAKKEYTEAGREVSKNEKSIKAKEKEIEDQDTKLVPIDEQINLSTKQLTKYTNRIQAIQKERQTQADQINSLEKDLKTVERAQAQWQTEWEQAAGRQGGQLSDADLREYNRLREEVGKRASADQSRVAALKSERGPQEATYNNLKNAVDSQEFRLQALETDKAQIDERKSTLSDTATQLQQEIDEKRRKLTTLSSQRLQTARQRTELDEKLAEVARKLLEADDGRRASEKEVRIRETIATLKRTYPGVKGRLHELCKPKQKKFGEAVSTVLGRHFDSVVVDTETTAKQCIEYLRDQRAGQATFIPLDTIQVKAINSSMKGSDPGVRLAIDTVDYDNALSRAVSYACGNAIVCDTLEIAKRMVYNKGVEAKAVTLDGTVIHKGGLITGGRGKDQNTRRWDEAEVDKLTKLKDQLLEKFSALPQDRVQIAEEQTLQNDLSGLENQLRYAQDEVEALNRNIESKQSEIRNVRKQLDTDRPKLSQEKGKLDEINQDIEDYSDTVREVEDEVFADFCARLGFDDIRDYEARQGSLQQEASQKKVEFITQKGRIEGQLNYEKTRLQSTDDRIQALQDKHQRDRQTIDELNEQKQGLQDDLETLKDDLDQLNAKLEQSKQKQQASSDKLNKARSEVQKRSKDMESSLKAISSAEGEHRRYTAGRYTVLRRCKIDDIQIPLTEGSATLEQLPINDLPLVAEDDPDSMDVDREDEDDPASSALQKNQVSDYGIDVDFSDLDDDLKEDSSSDAETQLQEAIEKINAQLSKMTPNSHAGTRLQASEGRLRDTEAEYRATHDRYATLSKEYNTVKRNRNNLFLKAYNHISEQIEPIYSNLTRSSEFPAGGRAFLSADEDEPYLAGVNYHTMPPAKRFRDMEHLSGGEKTMAALALLFAIHSYQPSPFFVLDEVDAALDNANVQKLVTYVRNHAGPGMQFIVISLKTGFFQGSEALVGVYRDQSANSSKSLTLDLRKYT